MGGDTRVIPRVSWSKRIHTHTLSENSVTAKALQEAMANSFVT